MTGVKAIRQFFGTANKPVTLEELKRLPKEDLKELGRLACEELHENYEEPASDQK